MATGEIGKTMRVAGSAAMLGALLAFTMAGGAFGQSSEECLVRAHAVRALIVSDEPSHQEFKDRIDKAEELCRTGRTDEAEHMLASVEADLQAGGTKQ